MAVLSANVNKPTDKALKEADINRKLQIYGIFSAFKAGKVPSNDQIDVALNSFLESKALSAPSDKLSAEGKKLVEDTREVVRLAKVLLLSKNEGNLIQDFIWQTTQFDPKSIDSVKSPLEKDAAKRDGEDALHGLRTLGTLLITNGQFRKLLKDASILIRDMVSDAAGGAGSYIRPSEEQLAQIDQAAEDNTWHEAPKFSKEELKKQAQGLYKGNAKKDAQEVVNAAQEAATPTGQGKDLTTEDAKAGVSAGASALKKKLDAHVDPEAKEKLKKRNAEYKAKTKEYLNKKMPQERRDQIIWRLKKMVLECQSHADYSEAIQTLLRLAEEYGKHGQSLGQSSTGSAKQVRTGFAAAEADLRLLIERFANGTSTSGLWESIGQIYKDADKDAELKGWFKSVDAYIRRCLLEQGYVLDEVSTKDWDHLYDQGRVLLREKYRGHTDRVLDETKALADQFEQDPHNKAFGEAVQRLFQDLGNDENGKSTFKPHLLKDVFNVILPSVLETTSYIPIPRIEYTDNQVDAVIENLVLESDNFMPNVLEIASENQFKWGRKKIANSNFNTMDVKVSGIQMDLRDVSFHVKRKTGFPRVSDTGVMDILLPGDGFSFRMKVATARKHDSQNLFKVEKVDVDFKSLNINLKKSKHKFLFKIAKPILLKALRPALQKAVEKAIKDKCNEFDATLWEIKKEAEAAGENVAEGEKKQGFAKRFYNASQKRVLENKEKAKAKKEEAKAKAEADGRKVNIAMTKEDSLFPALDLPGGVSTKASEYKQLAGKGEKWESPVFSIGKADKSTDIPSAPQVERKQVIPSTPKVDTAAAATTAAVSNGAATANGNGHANGNGLANGNGHTNGHANGNGIANGKAPAAAESTDLASDARIAAIAANAAFQNSQ